MAALLVAVAGCGPPGDGGTELLPPARGPYRRVTPVARYTPANLYEYIDGQAPYVVSFGFVELATADYRRAEEPVTTVDVYDMGSVENAFALFRSNANLEARPLAVGTEAAGGDGRVEFWQARYYVVVSNPAAEEDRHVRALAARLADDLPATDHRPACLAYLPEAGRVARSERFLPEAYLGYEPLRNALSARYRLGGEAPAGADSPGEVTLFACRYASAEAASGALAAFRSQVAGQSTPAPLEGPVLEAVGGRPDPSADAAASRVEGFVAEEFVMGRLVIFRSGRFLAGMVDAPATPAARALLSRLAGHLARRR